MKKSFQEWMREVDAELWRLVFMSHRDLADQPYHDWYDDRMRPKTAAKKALKEEGYQG